MKRHYKILTDLGREIVAAVITIFTVISLLICLSFLNGCASQKPFHKVVPVCVEVHIVSDISQFEYPPYTDGTKGVVGYATNTQPIKIFILGNKTDGLYDLDQKILGHELNHVLHFYDNEIRDTHDYTLWMKMIYGHSKSNEGMGLKE